MFDEARELELKWGGIRVFGEGWNRMRVGGYSECELGKQSLVNT